jgi:hypothetical protein
MLDFKSPIQGLLSVYSRCGLHTRAPIRDTLIEGFSHFVTSMTAPIASGWSGCRVGLAPTGKRRLSTAHAKSGHSAFYNLLISRELTQCVIFYSGANWKAFA